MGGGRAVYGGRSTLPTHWHIQHVARNTTFHTPLALLTTTFTLLLPDHSPSFFPPPLNPFVHSPPMPPSMSPPMRSPPAKGRKSDFISISSHIVVWRASITLAIPVLPSSLCVALLAESPLAVRMCVELRVCVCVCVRERAVRESGESRRCDVNAVDI